jgi:ribosomal protein L11 methyltransferase
MTGYLSLRVDLKGLDQVEARVEAAEAALFDAGALSVTLTDAVDDAILEPAPGEVRLWPQTVLRRCSGQRQVESIIVLARALNLPAERISVERVADRVWEREWLKDFHSMRFGRRLWIVPSHEQPPEEPGSVCVSLDPGLAFGTGTHPSTALCLTWLDSRLPPAAEVIDYGCGSGVLAIAAAKLGASSAQAFDIDPQALIATRENAAANDVAATVQVVERAADLPGVADAARQYSRRYPGGFRAELAAGPPAAHCCSPVSSPSRPKP